MKEISGRDKTVGDLLRGVRYSTDYYQREYKWEDKQIQDLVNDLTSKFLEGYSPRQHHERREVARYPHYFLGSIIVSHKDGTSYIVDGQQRLTTLTLLLIYLRHLHRGQKGHKAQVDIDDLIVSEQQGGQRSFNLYVRERIPCMDALYEGRPFDPTNSRESVRNLVERYDYLRDECFPDDPDDAKAVLRGKALPYFIDWLLRNVHLVEITAYSDDDAYAIFETVNDRGLRLSPTDMLKGYLLASITNSSKRTAAERSWRDRISELNGAGKDADSECLKAWLRSQYASKIRERRRGATPEDFDRIGTEFHRWLREARSVIGLRRSDDFCRFIHRDFRFYTRQYIQLVEASQRPVEGLEHVLYNADHGFTLQHMLLLAPLRPDDGEQVVKQKMRLVARFVDILLARRLWNSKPTAYSTMQYAMFLVMRDIRGLETEPLARKLYETLAKDDVTFDSNDRFGLRHQNRHAVHRLLARITDYVETQSDNPSAYVRYVSHVGHNRFEIEHIWANVYGAHEAEFADSNDFAEYRNRIGGLLLLPRSDNARYADASYEQKVKYYNKDTQNLLARSLATKCYQQNPGFVCFAKCSGLPFQAHPHFTKADLEARSELYRLIAKRVWNPDDLLAETRL